jgi:hypothetical protein
MILTFDSEFLDLLSLQEIDILNEIDDLDLHALQDNTSYVGFDENSILVINFWVIIQN